MVKIYGIFVKFFVFLFLFIFMLFSDVYSSMILIIIRGIVNKEIIKFMEGWCWFRVVWWIILLFGIWKNIWILMRMNIILIRGIVESW